MEVPRRLRGIGQSLGEDDVLLELLALPGVNDSAGTAIESVAIDDLRAGDFALAVLGLGEEEAFAGLARGEGKPQHLAAKTIAVHHLHIEGTGGVRVRSPDCLMLSLAS